MWSGACGLAAAARSIGLPQRKFGAQKERALVSRRVRGNLGEGLQMWDAIWLAGGAVFVALFIAFAWVTK